MELTRQNGGGGGRLRDFFLQSIPSLFEQDLHSDLPNVLEYVERRLDDHVYVIRFVFLQCEQQSARENLIQLLDLAIIIGLLKSTPKYRKLK